MIALDGREIPWFGSKIAGVKHSPTRTFNQEPSQKESRQRKFCGDWNEHDGAGAVICIDKSDCHSLGVRNVKFGGCIERYRVLLNVSVSQDWKETECVPKGPLNQ